MSKSSVNWLTRLGTGDTTACAAIATDQLTALYIEGIALDHLPLVKAALAQGLALVFLLGAGALKGDDISHIALPLAWCIPYNTVPMTVREQQKMEIEVAAYGWQGSEWDAFYPDDMPADWRLDYYANEFFAVVVPYGEWSAEDDDELLAWQEQVSDDFRFYWELPPNALESVARLQRLLADETFAAHWGGVVDLKAVTQFSQSPFGGGGVSQRVLVQALELRALRELLESAMEQARARDSTRLVVLVEADAAASLRPARDLALLLGGG